VRRKRLILTALIPLLLLMPMIGTAEAPLVTRVYLDPSNLGMVYPGTYLTVDIMIDNVVGLSAWEAEITWNPFVLTIIDATQGPFLSQNGLIPTYFLYNIDLLGNRITLSEMIRIACTTTSGSGLLATLTLKCIGAGSTSIDLRSTLLDHDLNPIDHKDFGSHVAQHPVCEVTGVWEEHQRYSISEDEDQYNELYANIANLGEIGTVNTYATFTGFATTGKLIILKSATVALPQGEETVVSVNFNAAQYGPGRYYFQVQAYSQIGGQWYAGARIKTLSFVVVP